MTSIELSSLGQITRQSKFELWIITKGKTMLPKNRKPTYPGQILLLDFLEPMGKTQKDFAVHLGWNYAKVNEIVNGRRGVTEEFALCFSYVFGTSAEFWLNLQMN